jgi:hypothetical protein
MLKPHLWVNHGFTPATNFETDAEWTKWEADYEKYILDFARLAQSEKWNFVLGRNSVMPLQNVLSIGHN